MKMWIVYRQTDEQTNNRQLEKLNWAFIHLIKFVNVFTVIPYYLPLERDVALHLNKLEFPSPKDALCQIQMFKLAQSFWRSFLNLVNVFSILLVSIWKIWIPFIQGCIVPSLVEIDPVVLEKKMKVWKVYDNNNDANDDDDDDNDDGQRTNF